MRKFLTVVVASLLLMCAAPVWAQMTQVKGTVTGQDGKPLQGAKIELKNLDNGQKYNLKTDKKGEFFSIGVGAGKYDITVYEPSGKSVTQGPLYKNVPITMSGNGTGQNQGVNMFDINLQQLAAQAATGQPASSGAPSATPQKLTPEQQKALEEQAKQRAAAEKEMQTVKGLNAMIAQAKAASDSGNAEQAVQTMQQAVQTDPTRDILWAQLGSYELTAAKKPGLDKEAKTKMTTEAAEAYKKAIDLCGPSNPKPAPSCRDAASYHNNLGQAYAMSGKISEAVAEYETAAKVNPAGAGQYYFNEGAVLTNIGKTDDANAAFDKAIAADPTRADAYYQKGVNLMSKASIDKEGHMIAPPGAKENIQKYLDLAPTGPLAESAKQLLEAMGQKVETSYGKGKKK